MSSAASGDSHQYARQLVQAYFRMLTVGCSNSQSSLAGCANECCKSHASNANRSVSPADAAIWSVYLATQAPTPLCIPIVSYFPMPQQHQQEGDNDDEARPETDDGDEDQEQQASDQQLSSSTPRRRLSSAVELDLTLNLSGSKNSETLGCGADSEQHRERVNQSLDGRKLSLPKQKLLDAITKSFPTIARRSVEISSSSGSSHPALRER